MRAPTKTPEQQAALMAFCETRRDAEKWKLMVLLSFKLGLRPIELAQLQTSHFRDDELRIQIGHTKGKGGRSLRVSAEILAALDAHMRGREGYVFLTERGQPFDKAGISSAIRRLYREAGQVGSCYSGRRSAGQRMQDEGANILVLQAFYGHQSPLTTMQYVGVSEAQLAHFMRLI